MYIVTRSIDHGRMAGMVSLLGIHTGTLFHIAGVALGLSALLASSAIAYNTVRWAGAAYLLFLGVRRLLERNGETDGAITAPPTRRLSRIYAQGVVVNVLNPKTALFFLAFLPQFVEADAASPSFQMAVYGVLFLVLGIISDGCYALLAARLGKLLRARRFARAQRYFSGGVLVTLGITAAFSGSRPSSD